MQIGVALEIFYIALEGGGLLQTCECYRDGVSNGFHVCFQLIYIIKLVLYQDIYSCFSYLCWSSTLGWGPLCKRLLLFPFIIQYSPRGCGVSAQCTGVSLWTCFSCMWLLHNMFTDTRWTIPTIASPYFQMQSSTPSQRPTGRKILSSHLTPPFPGNRQNRTL
jgi:hypothetical protein